MRCIHILRSTCIAAVGALALVSAPSNATTLALVAPLSTVGIMLTLPSSSACFQYTYDTNGNRLSSSATTIGGGGTMTWGSTTYGCAIWGQ